MKVFHKKDGGIVQLISKEKMKEWPIELPLIFISYEGANMWLVAWQFLTASRANIPFGMTKVVLSHARSLVDRQSISMTSPSVPSFKAIQSPSRMDFSILNAIPENKSPNVCCIANAAIAATAPDETQTPVNEKPLTVRKIESTKKYANEQSNPFDYSPSLDQSMRMHSRV